VNHGGVAFESKWTFLFDFKMQLLDCRLDISLRETSMPRPPRADEGGRLYHPLNTGDLCAEIFHEDA
jgi:hypothetical protein